MTLDDTIQQMSARLASAGVSFGHGTSNAFDEAVWLTLWRLGLPLDDLDGVADRPVTAAQQAAVEGGNLFAALMEACKVCTLGQLSGALYQVGGQYRRNM